MLVYGIQIHISGRYNLHMGKVVVFSRLGIIFQKGVLVTGFFLVFCVCFSISCFGVEASLSSYPYLGNVHKGRSKINYPDEWSIFTPTQLDAVHFPEATHDLVDDPYERLLMLGDLAQQHIQNSGQDPMGLDVLFRDITPQFIVQVIDQILGNDKLLERVTEASYYNATGFLKIVLITGGADQEYKIRLHVWNQGKKVSSQSQMGFLL